MATFLYNPDRKPKQALIAEFVVRTGIYEEIMHDLETSKMKHPEQHYLLVGQRGAGKTTLLNRIKYGVEDSAKLKKTLIPVLFSEEQYHISELANLWEAIAQYLEDYQGFDGLYEEMEANANKAHYEELSYQVLEKRLLKSGKKLVLLIDNVGDLLKKMEKTEVHRLREILQTKSEIRLIAGSPFYLETLLDYQQPLFEFFKVLRLDGLNRKETQELLLKLAELNGEEEKIKKIITETPERVETLRTLTGGVPRTIALMYNIFVKYNDENAVKDLEKILDAVTPLYKHRMDDLPTQQQKIVDAVAKNWDGISVKELKEKTRIESKIISAQLRQLEKNQVIEKVETNTKNHLYFLKERFFNIWYLMRYGRKQDKQRVIWLVKFLETWCSVDEIERRIIDFITKLQKGTMTDDFINLFGEVYIAIGNIRPSLRIMLKETTPPHLANEVTIYYYEIFEEMIENYEKGDKTKAFDLLQKIHTLDEDKTPKLVHYLYLFFIADKKQFLMSVRKFFKLITAKNNEINLCQYLQLLVLFSYSCAQSLIDGDIKKAHETWDLILALLKENENSHDNAIHKIVICTCYFFLAANQPNIVLQAFENMADWKEQLKPIYYVALKMANRNEEVLKAGGELHEKIDQIISGVLSARKKIPKLSKVLFKE